MAAAALIAMSGCAGNPAASAVPAGLSSGSSSLQASMVFPAHAQEKRYDAEAPGGLFVLRELEPVAASDIAAANGPGPDGAAAPAIVGGLHVRSRMYEAGADPATREPVEDRFLVLARDESGAVLLVSSREGGRTTTLDPPIVYMPPALEPGQTFEHESRAVVTDERGREQAHGRAIRRIEYVGDEEHVEVGSPLTPASRVRVVRAELDLDLFPARVVTTTTFWIDHRGIIREQQTTRVRILGVPAETRRHDVVLREVRELPADAHDAERGR